jgi:hypothetical protein
MLCPEFTIKNRVKPYLLTKTACRTGLIHVAAKRSKKRDANSIYFMRGIKKKTFLFFLSILNFSPFFLPSKIINKKNAFITFI